MRHPLVPPEVEPGPLGRVRCKACVHQGIAYISLLRMLKRMTRYVLAYLGLVCACIRTYFASEDDCL